MSSLHPSIIFAVFPLIFLGELPDKTMFASLFMASRGRPWWVYLGAATAFAVHVVIAVTAGAVLFHLVAHRLLQTLVGVALLGGAAYSYLSRHAEEEDAASSSAATSGLRTAVVAAGVIFVAEWGDLTQVLTVDLAARYSSPLSVGVGALAALLSVAAAAVLAGSSVLRLVSVRTLRITTAVVLVALGSYTLVSDL